jgi:opacity protein-like surface antigen
MKKTIAILLFVVFISVAAGAQTRMSDHNSIGWFTTTITPAITKKLSGHIEYQWRRDDLVSNWQQSLLRVGLNYKFHPQVTAHIGYGWILTFPYGDNTIAAVPKTFPEHRIYEQLVINNPIGKVNVQHRFRLEQRWVGKLKTITSEKPDEMVYLNRVRYMCRVDVPIYKKLYAAGYDELFVGVGKNVGENVFDQNRIGILAGYKFNSMFRIEGGFLNQTVQLGREVGGKNVFQYNNGFILNTYVQLN